MSLDGCWHEIVDLQQWNIAQYIQMDGHGWVLSSEKKVDIRFNVEKNSDP